MEVVPTTALESSERAATNHARRPRYSWDVVQPVAGEMVWKVILVQDVTAADRALFQPWTLVWRKAQEISSKSLRSCGRVETPARQHEWTLILHHHRFALADIL